MPPSGFEVNLTETRSFVGGVVRGFLPATYGEENVTTDSGYGVVVEGDITYIIIPGSHIPEVQNYLVQNLGFALNSLGTEEFPREKVLGISVRRLQTPLLIDSYQSYKSIEYAREEINTELPINSLYPLIAFNEGESPESIIYNGNIGEQIINGEINYDTPFLASYDGVNYVMLNGREVIENQSSLVHAVHGTFPLYSNGRNLMNDDNRFWRELVGGTQRAFLTMEDRSTLPLGLAVIFNFEGSDEVFVAELPVLSLIDDQARNSFFTAIEEAYSIQYGREMRIDKAFAPDVKYTGVSGGNFNNLGVDILGDRRSGVSGFPFSTISLVITERDN
ncbi:MAG: hypothetical protein Q9M91_05085 [Candidatus Dojkabacteria bacterium]|nr:hypothetical protein [Candidatus Dojkabacteria bacterium]MDQ7021180.1 hypothetical protein [Candidatus Dojkabacteria bacterium]